MEEKDKQCDPCKLIAEKGDELLDLATDVAYSVCSKLGCQDSQTVAKVLDAVYFKLLEREMKKLTERR